MSGKSLVTLRAPARLIRAGLLPSAVAEVITVTFCGEAAIAAPHG
jgi:hypothetical protein